MPSITRPSKTDRTRRDAARGQVLDAVDRLLDEGESFTSLGVGRIAERAGISRSAFYTNFTDKTDLLLQLTADATSALFDAASAWIHSKTDDGVDGLARTQMNTLRILRANTAVLAAYAEVAAYDGNVAGYWNARIDELVDAFAERIIRGQAAGLVRESLAPHATAMFIVWGAERATTQHVRVDDGSGDEQFAGDIAHAAWTMLFPEPVS